jgi:hypothetical protein
MAGTEATMKTSTATVTRAAALLLSFSACGCGSILLGSNDDTSPGEAGSAGHTGQTTGPSADASREAPTADATVDRSRPDANPSIDDSDGAPGDSGNSAGDGNLGPGFALLSDCGYTQVDPHNCGVCGHDCAGGACQAGVCVPLPPGVLASGLIAPTSVAVDANNVYWLSEGQHPTQGDAAGAGPPIGLVQVMKCAKTGCNNTPTVLASGSWDLPSDNNAAAFVYQRSGKDSLHGLAVDGTNVYWATEFSLMACAIDGCNNSPTVLADTPNSISAPAPSVISVSEGIVYSAGEYGAFGCPATGCVGDGGGAGASDILWSGSAQGVLVDSTNVYWNSNGALMSCAIGGCNSAPTLLDQANNVVPEAIGQIAEDDTYLYYTYGAATSFQSGNGPGYIAAQSGPAVLGNVFSCSKKGIASGGTALVGMFSGTQLANPMGLATDGTNVFFTELGDGVSANATDVGRVGRCSVTGCTGDGATIADHLENPRGIAVDATNVYWADFGSGILDSNAQLLLSVDGRIMTSTK